MKEKPISWKMFQYNLQCRQIFSTLADEVFTTPILSSFTNIITPDNQGLCTQTKRKIQPLLIILNLNIPTYTIEYRVFIYVINRYMLVPIDEILNPLYLSSISNRTALEKCVLYYIRDSNSIYLLVKWCTCAI